MAIMVLVGSSETFEIADLRASRKLVDNGFTGSASADTR